MATGRDYLIEGVGVMTPKAREIGELGAGEVGFVYSNIKTVADVQIGDTITETARQATEALPGFMEIKPMVFAGLYPVESDQYEELRDALDKLRLNDSSFFFEPEHSAALGFAHGNRAGTAGTRVQP
jgi:GTP-binding protein LepA